MEKQPVNSGLYRFDHIATGVNGFEAVTEREVRHFHEQGFLVVHAAFSAAEAGVALDALADLIAGKHPEHKGLEFEKGAEDIEALTCGQRQDVVRKVWKFVEYEPRLKALSAHPKLIAVVERLLNGKALMFQDMALLKPPRVGREKPWHQDGAYFNLKLETVIAGVWIALDEATAENGCMHIIPGSHRRGPMLHFQRRDWQICDSQVDVEGDTLVPLAPGGCLFFHGLLHHGTPPNTSCSRRRALQFHYKPADSVETSQEERLAIFGSEGKNVSC